ncbi:hypothetical protein [Vibrio natriegens]|uniref:hypothetical protein n=1 Tax=Vibrio natriegens TaxID=691 RepID=UPI003909CBD5
MAIYNKHDWLSDQKEAYEKFAEALFAQVQKELEHEKVAVSYHAYCIAISLIGH